MKKLILLPLSAGILLYLLLFPQTVFQASARGLQLWFSTVLPSLLPFLILSDIFLHTGLIPTILHPFSGLFSFCFGISAYGAYALCLGLLCGYPMGARLTADLLAEKKISHREAEYLLTFTNNPSPMFLSSYVLLHMMGKSELQGLTFGILYASVFLTACMFRICYRQKRSDSLTPSVSGGKSGTELSSQSSVSDSKSETEPSSLQTSFSRMIDTSIMNGFETITRLGGYILLFSILASMISHLPGNWSPLTFTLPGILEITTGIDQIRQSGLSFFHKYQMIMTCVAFGGLSTVAQTKGMLIGTPLSIHTYLFGKLTQAAFTFFLCGLLHILNFI